MTMYFLSGYSEVVVEDPYVVDLGEECLFVGATLIGQSFVPNPLSRLFCHALGLNKHLVILPDGMQLQVDGQKIAHFGYDFKYTHPYFDSFPHRGRNGKIDLDLKYSRVEEPWSRVNRILDYHYQSSEDAKLIKRIIQEWEKDSRATLELLKSNLGESDLQRGKVEILVSGTRWLIRYCDQNRLVMGESKDVWGNAPAPPEWTATRMATPFRDGWIIKASTTDWLIQRKSDGSIKSQQFFCPYGAWRRLGLWTSWDWEQVVLTPTGHVVSISKELSVIDATSRWALCRLITSPDTKIAAINTKGEVFYAGAMGEQHPGYTDLWAGNNGAFVWEVEHGYYYCSMIPESNLPSLRHAWKLAVCPDSASLRVHVMRGNPDTLIALFTPFLEFGWGICLLNTERKAWWIFFPDEYPLFPSSGVPGKNLGGGRVELEFRVVREKKDSPLKIKLEVSRNFVRLDRGWPVAITGEMTDLPDRETALLERLMPFFEPQTGQGSLGSQAAKTHAASPPSDQAEKPA